MYVAVTEISMTRDCTQITIYNDIMFKLGFHRVDE